MCCLNLTRIQGGNLLSLEPTRIQARRGSVVCVVAVARSILGAVRPGGLMPVPIRVPVLGEDMNQESRSINDSMAKEQVHETCNQASENRRQNKQGEQS